jgi:hypothetical protein
MKALTLALSMSFLMNAFPVPALAENDARPFKNWRERSIVVDSILVDRGAARLTATGDDGDVVTIHCKNHPPRFVVMGEPRYTLVFEETATPNELLETPTNGAFIYSQAPNRLVPLMRTGSMTSASCLDTLENIATELKARPSFPQLYDLEDQLGAR